MSIRLLAIFVILPSLTLANLSYAQHLISLDTINILIEKGQYDRAIAALQQRIDADINDVHSHFLKGIVEFQHGNFAAAETTYLTMAELFPRLPEVHINLSAVYAEQKHYQKAQQALQKAIAIAPDSAIAHTNLGDLHVLMAEQAYERATKLAPDDDYASTRTELLRYLNKR